MQCKITRIREVLENGEALGVRNKAALGKQWRQRRITAISARCKEHGWDRWLYDAIAAIYGAVELKELTDDQLQATYRAVAKWSIDELHPRCAPKLLDLDHGEAA